MSSKSLDVFSLRDAVIGEYRKFATSFTTIQAEDIRHQVEAIYAQNRYWPDPLIQINPSYKRTTTVEQLVAEGVLDTRCADIFRTAATTGAPDGQTLSLYKHQEQAIARAAQGQSFVVTTGTGSGKSLCFFIPIVNAVLAERRNGGPPRTRAIVIYPMNALANSQREELDKFLSNYIMETFPIVRKNDQKAHGEYRTKRVIVEIYDAMAEAARTGKPYQTRLDPPPADPRVAHPDTRKAKR